MFGFADFYFVHECMVVQAQKENELACSEGTKALFSHLISFSFSYLLSVCLCFSLCFGIPDHLTCLLRNLYADQEATVRTGHRTTNWLQIGKGVLQGCILSTCLFNLYAEFSSVQFSSVAQLCPTLCDPMECSMPGFPVHYQFPKFTQTYVH